MSKEQAQKLKTWVKPKELEIYTLKQSIESAELRIKHAEESVKGGWFVLQAKNKIREATNDLQRKSEEFELEKIEADIKNGFVGRADRMVLEDLKIRLKIDEDSLVLIKKNIIKAERNHDISEVPVEKVAEAKTEEIE